MSSNVLPQALCTIPRNPILCRPKTLGFSAFVSRRPYPIDSARLSTSCVTLSAFGPSLDPLLAKMGGSRSFIVRADSNPEGEGAVENVGETEAVVLEAAEAEAGVETDDAAVENEPRKPRIKMGDIMGILNKRAVEASDNFRPIPDLRPGDIIELKMQVQETKRRLSVYKGIIIGRQNAGIHTTIRVRRIIAGIGVEIVFPIYSPLIKEIKLIKHRKVRRAKLYYLRDKLPRFSTFK